MLEILLLTVIVVALAMLAMGIGTIASNRCLRGSCGGPEVLDANGEPLGCDACPFGREAEAAGRRRVS